MPRASHRCPHHTLSILACHNVNVWESCACSFIVGGLGQGHLLAIYLLAIYLPFTYWPFAGIYLLAIDWPFTYWPFIGPWAGDAYAANSFLHPPIPHDWRC
jgi:hypothetical protein